MEIYYATICFFMASKSIKSIDGELNGSAAFLLPINITSAKIASGIVHVVSNYQINDTPALLEIFATAIREISKKIVLDV